MCGLVAVASTEQPIARDRMDRALDAIAHRGPDGRGVWLAQHQLVALGHVRLALVDREGGAQPISSEDGAVHAIVNGEFYDAAPVRASLIARGHVFRSRSDSELLVHLYEEHGAACLHHLHGEFAFVLHDARTDTLFAARDPFGVRPIVYALHAGALVLASEAKALFAWGVPARWHTAALRDAFQMHYCLPGDTLFEGVHALPAGHQLVYTRGQTQVTRYTTRTHTERTTLTASLTEAVKRRLEADTPVAFQLSGGVDSASVLALARPLLHNTPHAFTVSFPDAARWDEVEVARAVASRLQVTLHEVPCPRDALMDALEPAVAQGEGVAINLHIAAKYKLSRAVHDAGFKAVLTGEGADEMLLGYPHFRQDALAHDQHEAHAALRAAHAVSSGAMLAEGDTLPLDALGERAPSFLRAKAAMGLRMRALLEPDALHPHDAFARLIERIPHDPREDTLTRAQRMWCELALAGYILRTLGDAMEMAHAVESRLPFLDRDVVATVRTLPREELLRPMPDGTLRDKWALRSAMEHAIPNAMREKHPFFAPPLDPLHPLVHDTLRSPNALPPGVSPARVIALLDRVASLEVRERIAWEPVLMLLVSASILQRRYAL